MDASILLVGSDDFITILQEPIRNLATFSIGVAPNPHEAMPLIHAQQPDILVVQADRMGVLDLCQQIKSQGRLAWIYCILVDVVFESNWVKAELDQEQIATAEITALESGADAYLAVYLPELTDGKGFSAPALSQWQYRLVRANVAAGLRRVKNHRELMRTNDLLSAIALSDPLTELNNRRAFEWELPRQIQNARSRNMPISLIMLDVDYFKMINDTYGHLVGDRALQLFSSRLRHNLRFYDTPFRYGGEEFVIILSDTGSQEATLIAYRICQLISQQPFAINDTLDLNMTVSAGAASLRAEDDAKGLNLLHRADQNLLKAKSQGRNRVVSDEDDDNFDEN
jgi:two-component system, cell cycle response regulator